MAIKVAPNIKNPTHDVSFIIEGGEYGFMLDGGPQSMREIPLPPNNTPISTAQGKFGDYEHITHIEQRSWEGGFGSDDFSVDKMRFFDSKKLYSMIPGRIFPAPQTRFATGLRTVHENMPGNIGWQKLTGNERYVSSTFTVGGSNLSADNLNFWIRRIGSPGTLTAEIWTDSGGDPNAVVTSATKTVTTSIITDFVSEFWTFDLSAAADLSSSTAYHVVLYAASTDSAANYWEVGVDTTGSASKDSSAGSSWATASFSLYYRLTDTDIDRKWRFFFHQDALYAVDDRADEATSVIYMNGERGEATSGTATTLVDTDEGMDTSWADDQWNGYYIWIRSGTGKNQWRLITDTVAATSTISVSPDWDKTPSTDSEYVIYGGPAWQAVTTPDTLPAARISSVVSVGWKAFFALGADVNMMRMQFDADNSPPSHDFADDGTNRADLIFFDQDAVDGPKIIKILNPKRSDQNAKYSSGDEKDWGTSITFGDDIKIRSGGHDITNLIFFEDQKYIIKTDGLYTLSNERAKRLEVELGFSISPNNGLAATVHDGKMFFSWGEGSLMRMIGKDVGSIGPDRGLGMPAGRTGGFSALLSHPNHLFACLDAGTGTSSVLVRDNASFGWHEIERGWGTDKRIQGIEMQTNPGTNPYLWMSANGEIVYQKWPIEGFNPLKDTSMLYAHEAVLELSDIDLGSSQISKFLTDMNLISNNLATGIEIHLDVKLDKDIESSTSAWTTMGTFHQSDADVLELGLGDVRKARFRLRLITNDASTPPTVFGTVLEGFARLPIKYRYPMRVTLNSSARNKRGQKDIHPKEKLDALRRASVGTEKVIMHSIRGDRVNDIEVIIGPQNVVTEAEDPRTGNFVATAEFEVRDA